VPSRRDAIAGIAGLVLGIAVGMMDSRPGYDDTGVTAVALAFATALVTFISSRRPWLWALVVGSWVPLFEVRDLAKPAPLLALAFAGAGAAVGWLVARSGRAPGEVRS
jgi:hypothetical protein